MDKIFKSEKKITKRNLLFKILEVLIVALILLGTIFTYASKEGFIVFFGSKIKDIVFPQLPKSTQQDPKKKILEAINNKINIKEIEKNDPNSLEILSSEDVRIFFSYEKDIDTQINSLQTIQRQAKIEGRKIKKIDLRYDKIIIEY